MEQPALRRRWSWRLLRWTIRILSIASLLAAGAIYFGIGTKMDVPHWLRMRLEARLVQDLNGMTLEFGDLNLVVNQGWRPRIGMRDVTLRAPDGTTIVQLADAEISMAMRPLLQGKVQPKRISLSGLYANLRRESDGIALSLSQGGGTLRQAANLPQLIEQWDRQFEFPVLSALTEISTDGVTLRYEDARLGRVWTLDGGHVRLTRQAQTLTISAGFSVLSGRQDVGAVEANYKSDIGDAAAEFGILVNDIASEDIAVQAPVLGWLQVLRAPISGSLRGGIGSDGGLLPLAASLQIGRGVIQPAEEALPIPIHGAHSYFTFFPLEQRLQFDELKISSGWGAGTMEGQAELAGISDGRLTDLVGQLRFTDLTLNPKGLYETPQVFTGVTVDFRMRPQPFRFQLGEMLIEHEGRQILLDGEIETGALGWEYGVNARSDLLDLAQVKSLWPSGAAEKPRLWVLENIFQAQAEDVNFSLRGKGLEKPFFALDASFTQAEVKYQKHMPRVRDGAGHFSLYNNRMVVVATDGVVIADQGGELQIAGTSFIIPDTSVRNGPPGIARIVARGAVTAGLSLLNRPPLSILDKAQLPVDLSAGQVRVVGTLSLPLKPKLATEEVLYHYQGVVSDVQSTVLIPNHEIAARSLVLRGDQGAVSLTGKGTLSGIPVTATWRQPLGQKANQASVVTGEIEVTPTALVALNVGLPKGTLAGQGRGNYRIDLAPDAPPRLQFTSDLLGMDLRIPSISWRKASETRGALDMDVTLSEPVKIDSLTLSTPGLDAQGWVTTHPGGGLKQASLAKVRVGNWMQGAANFVAVNNGLVELQITGGTLDLQKAPFSGSSSSGSGSSEAQLGPISMRLDSVKVTDSIALANFAGRFSTNGGVNGQFTGNLNGLTPVSGVVVPQAGGIATRIRSEDAGGVFRAAGVLRHGQGGDFDMTLIPAEKAGEYDGEIKISNTRIKNAPSMAALLNAISVIGLVDELSGGGILFTGVEAKFRLGSTHLVLHESSAVGPSLGLSMDGVYDLRNSVLDMRGVISPIYIINAIGRVVARKGEGLIGFAFRLRGTSDDPKVSVNPLSALAPGIFRDIFRGKAPTVPGAPVQERQSKPSSPPPASQAGER